MQEWFLKQHGDQQHVFVNEKEDTYLLANYLILSYSMVCHTTDNKLNFNGTFISLKVTMVMLKI